MINFYVQVTNRDKPEDSQRYGPMSKYAAKKRKKALDISMGTVFYNIQVVEGTPDETINEPE